MIVAKNILHYLKGTQDYGMFYTIGGEDYFTSFVNNDYSHDHDTIISMSHIVQARRVTNWLEFKKTINNGFVHNKT